MSEKNQEVDNNPELIKLRHNIAIMEGYLYSCKERATDAAGVEKRLKEYRKRLCELTSHSWEKPIFMRDEYKVNNWEVDLNGTYFVYCDTCNARGVICSEVVMSVMVYDDFDLESWWQELVESPSKSYARTISD